MKSKELRKFSYAYYLRSTALTMPVLPIWWSERPDVGFAIYLSGMAIQGIASTIIDFPLSIWSDKTHPRAPYALGLTLFALAFISASFGSLTGFIAYLIFISLAGALMSGSDNALLLQIAGSQFKAELYELNRRFYLYTSGLFLVGVGCYLVSPLVLFMLQASSLILAAICIVSISTDPAKHESALQPANLELHSVSTTGEGWKIVPTLKWFLVALSVCIIGGEFEAANQLLNRSVQVLTAGVGIPGVGAGLNGMWSVAFLLIITNLVAALGLGTKARLASERLGLPFTLIVLAFGCIASLLLVNSGFFVLIIFGSTLMGTVKGVFRPLFTSLAVQTLPAMNWTARWISLTGMASGLVSSLANVSVVFGDPSPSEILNRMAIQILVVSLPLIALICKNRVIKVPLKGTEMSMKTTQRVIRLGSEHPATLE